MHVLSHPPLIIVRIGHRACYDTTLFLLNEYLLYGAEVYITLFYLQLHLRYS